MTAPAMLTPSEWNRVRSTVSVAEPQWITRGAARAAGIDPDQWPDGRTPGGLAGIRRRGPIGIPRNCADPIAPKKADRGRIPVLVRHGLALPSGDHYCLAVGTSHDVAIGRGTTRRAAGWIVVATVVDGERTDIPRDHPAYRFGVAWLHVDAIKPIAYADPKEVTR